MAPEEPRGLRHAAALALGPVALALGSTVLFFHRAVFSSDVLIARDMLRVYPPLRQYWADRVSRGELPEWYSFDGLGQPFLGTTIAGGLHPFNLLGLLMPVSAAVKLWTLACFPLAFLGVFLLARRLLGVGRPAALVAGCGYTFCGYLVSMTNNQPYVTAAATVPWALWAVERFLEVPTGPRLSAAAGLTALILFAGDPQAMAVTSALALLLVARRVTSLERRRVAQAALQGAALLVATALVASPQLAAARAVLGDSVAGARTVEQAQLWSMHPLRLVELLVGPLFSCTVGTDACEAVARHLLDTGTTSPWAGSLHWGAVFAALAVVGVAATPSRRLAWALAAVALVAAGLALGKHTPLYSALFSVLPPWRPFRYPEKLVPFVLLPLALLAALGADRLLGDPSPRRRTGLSLLALGGLFGVGAVAELLGAAVSSWLAASAAAEARTAALTTLLAQNAMTSLLSAAAACGLVGTALAWGREPRFLAAALAVVPFSHLLVTNEPAVTLGPSFLLDRPPQLAQEVRARSPSVAPGAYRLSVGELTQAVLVQPGLDFDESCAASVASSLVPLLPSLWGMEGATAYLPATSRRAERLFWSEQWDARFAPAVGALYRVEVMRLGERGPEPPPGAVAVSWPFRLALVQVPEALPRAYLARAECVSDAETAFRRFAAPSFRPGVDAVVECAAPGATGDAALAAAAGVEAQDRGTAAVDHFAPEEVTVRSQARTASVLVLNDAYYAGWTATLDGSETAILPANHAVRGVLVPPGDHTVVFRYRTPGLRLALLLAVLALAFPLLDRRRPLRTAS